MKYRVRRIGVLKAGIMGGACYAIIALVFVPAFLFFALLAPVPAGMGAMPGEWAMGGALALLLPVINGVVGFVGTAIAAAIFNLLAMLLGGLDIELERIDPDPRAPAQPAPPMSGY